MATPGPVKISHKKDGRQRHLHRFHVSRLPLTRPLDPLLKAKYRLKVAAVRRQCQVVVKRGVALWYVE